MKKTFVILLGLMIVVFLSACGDKKPEEVIVENDNVDVEQVSEDLGEENIEVFDENLENDDSESEYTKSSLRIEDLEQIDDVLFPVSYNYEVYKWEDEDTSDSGTYTYPENIDHSLLLPIHADVVSREVVSSSIEDGMIYTIVNATLKDDSVVSILYINDPITLKYIAASVNGDEETTLYSFVY